MGVILGHSQDIKVELLKKRSDGDFQRILPVTNVYNVMGLLNSDSVISDDNEKISNENIYVADKKDIDASKRVFRLRFTFKNKKYDKSNKYYLVAYDEKNDLEVIRHEIQMDLAFADDFGFNH